MRLKLAIWLSFSVVALVALVSWLDATQPGDFVAGAAVFGVLFVLCLGPVWIYARWRWPEDYGR